MAGLVEVVALAVSVVDLLIDRLKGDAGGRTDNLDAALVSLAYVVDAWASAAIDTHESLEIAFTGVIPASLDPTGEAGPADAFDVQAYRGDSELMVEEALAQDESLYDVAWGAALSQRRALSRVEHLVEDHGIATIPSAIQTLTVFAPDLSRDLQRLLEVRRQYLTESLSALQHVEEVDENVLSEYGNSAAEIRRVADELLELVRDRMGLKTDE